MKDLLIKLNSDIENEVFTLAQNVTDESEFKLAIKTTLIELSKCKEKISATDSMGSLIIIAISLMEAKLHDSYNNFSILSERGAL